MSHLENLPQLRFNVGNVCKPWKKAFRDKNWGPEVLGNYPALKSLRQISEMLNYQFDKGNAAQVLPYVSKRESKDEHNVLRTTNLTY